MDTSQRFPTLHFLGVRGRGRGRGPGRGPGQGRGSAGGDGSIGRRDGRSRGGASDGVIPTGSRILQSPHTKAALKRMSEQTSVARLEEAAGDCAAMMAAKKRSGS